MVDKPIYSLTEHSEVTVSLFSPDGKVLASSSRDKTIRLLDNTDGQPIRTLGSHASDGSQ